MKQPLDKKLAISFPILLVVIITVIVTTYLLRHQDTNVDPNLDPAYSNTTEKDKEVSMKAIQLTVNDRHIDVALEDNAATKALLEKLEAGDILVNLEDYGGFEKVGNLGFSLPTSDEELTTSPGDLVLYEGDKITLHYGSNTWSYTRLGHAIIPPEDLTALLGDGNIAITLSVK